MKEGQLYLNGNDMKNLILTGSSLSINLIFKTTLQISLIAMIFLLFQNLD